MTIYNAFWVFMLSDRIFHNLLMITVELVISLSIITVASTELVASLSIVVRG